MRYLRVGVVNERNVGRYDENDPEGGDACLYPLTASRSAPGRVSKISHQLRMSYFVVSLTSTFVFETDDPACREHVTSKCTNTSSLLFPKINHMYSYCNVSLCWRVTQTRLTIRPINSRFPSIIKVLRLKLQSPERRNTNNDSGIASFWVKQTDRMQEIQCN
jgi:hypothetical protein